MEACYEFEEILNSDEDGLFPLKILSEEGTYVGTYVVEICSVTDSLVEMLCVARWTGDRL